MMKGFIVVLASVGCMWFCQNASSRYLLVEIDTDLECVCNDHTSGRPSPKTGYGNYGRCQVPYEPYFGDEKFCYVDVPSGCADAKESKPGSKYYVSAEACMKGYCPPACRCFEGNRDNGGKSLNKDRKCEYFCSHKFAGGARYCGA